MKKKITNPDIISELRELNRIHNGILHPKIIVDHARDESSALHDSFEWDDTKAAEAYRIEQARAILQVTVEIIQDKDHKVVRECRVFMSLSEDRKKGGYRTTVDILSDAVLRRNLLRDALDELERIRVKYSYLTELAEVFSAIDRVKRKKRKK